MTDFGTKDGNTGVMKGVIYGIIPDVKIVDISHYIAPQNIREAAWVLDRQIFYFPKNSVHVVVVDPGVGTQRRPIAAQIGSQFVVGPDNGVFTPLLMRAERKGWPVKIVHTDKPEYWLPEISDIFHGRDIFSPVGAHLAAGVPLEKLGTLIDDPVRIEFPIPTRSDNVVVGTIIHIDNFGNVISNIHREDLAGVNIDQVLFADVTIKGMARTFGDGQIGDLIALYTSTGYVMASVVNGNAAEFFQPEIGAEVRVIGS
jgi:S-adenosyl-L-methionine hydrolase (adenosine-forming)